MTLLLSQEPQASAAEQPAPLIEAEGLAKNFGEFAAVKNVSLRVLPGEVLALLGHNGAGKTTTTRMLTATLKPTRGTARVAGWDTIQNPLEVRRSIGHLTEQPGLYNRMRIVDYLRFFGEIQGITGTELQSRTEHLLQRFDLWETRQLRLGEYSKGMRQKAALVRALLHEPQVLFLDEPTSAMDPHSAKMVRDAIAELKAANRAIVLCTHNLLEAEILASRIAIIRKGEIIEQGTAEQLKRKLLGAPHFSVLLSQPIALLPENLNYLPGFRLISQDKEEFVFETEIPGQTNPLVWRALAEQGLEVITLSQVPRSLEAVYLKIAGNIENEKNRDEAEQLKQKQGKVKSLPLGTKE